ncbi:haloacid dehalogenase-like hydrolase domain-containing protein 3 [Oppia nitens]|uniref:haloacid dehalogenase-like hydrolase domain-containing protein 3 n=1 Tax=Oppia nitens TaxID=1686743 RepID=UPI0023DB1047|nr:haloacid dehalogenase-like hydrolase domain-containing protein 3 [Oppia nitens]
MIVEVVIERYLLLIDKNKNQNTLQKNMSALRVVTLDVTNTLITLKNSIGHEYIKAMQLYCTTQAVRLHPNCLSDRQNDLSKAFTTVWKDMNAKHENFGFKSGMSSVEWWTQVVKRTVRLANFSVDDLNDNQLDLMAKYLYRAYCSPQFWTVDVGVHQAMTDIKKSNPDLKLGIISNFDERLGRILQELGLRHYFDFLIISRLVGCCKPSADIFNLALNTAELSDPSLALHIGDNIELDYLCAKRLGWNALLLNRNNRHNNNNNLSNDQRLSPIDIISDLKQF